MADTPGTSLTEKVSSFWCVMQTTLNAYCSAQGTTLYHAVYIVNVTFCIFPQTHASTLLII